VAADRLRGAAVASDVRDGVAERVAALREQGVVPTLATVLTSDDASDVRFVELKHEACEAVGVESRDVRVAPDAPVERVHATVEACAADEAVDAVFVQAPLPDHVPERGVRSRVAPAKDVDAFHPETLGRLVADDPTFVPATTAAVGRLLDAYGLSVAGRDVVVVGRSSTIGRPLASRLLRRGEGGDATVTVCHSRTADLAAHTRRADVLVTAAGVPGLVDGSMLSPGVVVVDVSANRRETDDGVEVVGDVAFESASEVASAITPVPGGVGPVTLACLLENVVLAAERRA
jgi:methylenetetrahydrofolate dehydrogenase (NADP+)/methenyltetrahydrofolate cyclohydrolase